MQRDLTYPNDGLITSLQSKFLIPILVFLVTTVGVFPLDVYLPSMLQMATIFGVSIAQIASTISYFTFSFALMQLAYGPLSDALGRKIILLSGLLIGGIATISFLFVKSYYALVVLRVIQALGLSSFVVTQAIIRDKYTGISAVRFQIYVAVFSGALIAISPLFGSLLQKNFDWQGNFVVCGAIICLTFFYVMIFYKETNNYINAKNILPHNIVRQYFLVIKNRIFDRNAMIAMLAFATHFSFVVNSAYLFIDVLKVSTLHFGFIMLVYGSFYLFSGFFATKLAEKFHLTDLITIGAIFIFSGAVLMLVFYWAINISVSAILFPMIFTILGVTLVRPTAITKALSPFPEKAGFCAAALGLVQYSGAGLLSFLVNFFENSSQLPIAILLLFSSLSIFLLKEAE